MSIEKCSCIATRKTGRATFRLLPAMHRMIGTEPWRIIFFLFTAKSQNVFVNLNDMPSGRSA